MSHAHREASFSGFRLERVAGALEHAFATARTMARWWAHRAGAAIEERLETLEERFAAARAKGAPRVPLWVAIALIIVAALAMQAVTLRGAEERHALQSRQLKQIYLSEQATTDARARETIAQAGADMHRLSGTSIAWVIRTALARHNLDEIDQYLAEIASHERVKLAVLADRNGKIIAASDGGLKGSDFGRHFPNALLQDAAVTVHTAGEEQRVVIPIMRFSARLGTALLVYESVSLAAR